jgi:restriction endonuclease Mrr
MQLAAGSFNIAEADLREMLPSGTQTKVDNRIVWAEMLVGQRTRERNAR